MRNKNADKTAERSSGGFEAILTRAAARRPIQPKSVIMTIFGDSVVPRGGVIWLGSIVKLAAQLGLAEPLVRTSALRLVYDGWLVNRQAGKRRFYSMSEDYAAANAAYQDQIYNTSSEVRRNGWTIFCTFASKLDRKASYKLRNTLFRYGFGQLAPLVFIHPSIGKSAVQHIMESNGKSDGACVAFFAQEVEKSPEMMRHLVSASWDLSEVRQGYDDFIESFEMLPKLLEKEEPLPAVTFALRTLMVHQFRRLVLRDPRLPENLFSDGWPGEKAFRLISRSYPRLLPASEAYLDQAFVAESGAAPAAKKEIFQRFQSKS